MTKLKCLRSRQKEGMSCIQQVQQSVKYNKQMIKRYYQRRETKCNFCFEWFSSECILKNSIHLCGPCIDKALNTTCYKVPSPDGKQSYQLYLFRNNLRVTAFPDEQDLDSQSLRNNLIQSIDEFRNRELKKLSQKWADITEELKRLPNITDQQMQNYTQIFNDSIRNYPSASQILISNIKEAQPHEGQIESRIEDPNEVYLIKPELPKEPTNDERVQLNYQYLSPPTQWQPLMEVQKEPNKQGETLELEKGCHKHDKGKRNSLRSNELKMQENQKSKLNRDSSQESLVCGNFKKRQQFVPYTKEKRQKDLKLIAQNALKSKIYNYLENYSTVPPALYLPMTLDIYDAIQNTSNLNRCIQLVSHSLQELDIKCYLNMLDWSGADVLKLVKVGLCDQQFKEVINFVKDKRIQTLVVTSNKLTQDSISYIGDNRQSMLRMKNLYLGRNRIQKFKVKETIKQIENKFILYL